MRKLYYLGIMIIFSVIILIGCQSDNEKMNVLDYPITEISISESDGYEKIGDNIVTTLDKEENLTSFEEIMRSAVKKNETLTDEKPGYDIVVTFESGESRETQINHLILGNEGEESIFVSGNEERYFVSPEDTTQLRELIISEE